MLTSWVISDSRDPEKYLNEAEAVVLLAHYFSF